MKNAFVILLIVFSVAAHSAVVERIIAIVNDSVVTLSDMATLEHSLKSEGLLDKALLDMYDIKKIKTSAEARLEFLIDERILDSEVAKAGVVSPIEKVEAEIRKIIEQNGTSREQLKASLKSRKIGYAEYQAFVKSSLERQTLLSREVASKIKISDDDVASYFIQNVKSSKPLVFEYELSHMLFNVAAGKAIAMEKAQEVHGKLSAGGNFETLAAKHSEDPHFTQGGAFGTVRVGDVIPVLEKALSNLRAGDVTSPVEMPDGIHLFKVIKRNLVPSPELQAQREGISRLLFTAAFAQQYKSWIEQKRQASYIRNNLK